MPGWVEGARRRAERGGESVPTLLAAVALTVALIATAVIALVSGVGDDSSSADAGGVSPTSPSDAASGPRSSGASGAAAPTADASGQPRSSAAARPSACTDVRSLQALNRALDQTSTARLRTQFGQIASAAGRLRRDAPQPITKAARNFLGAVTTLRHFVNRARSVDDLQANADPHLAGAFTDLAQADQRISAWAATHC